MRQAADALEATGTHYTIYQSLRDVSSISEQNFFAGLYADVLLVSEPDFFSSLYAEIERNLSPAYTPQRQNLPASAFEFQDRLISLVRRSDRNLALFIDDLEMAPPNLVAALLGALRAAFTIMIDQPGARFQAVVCGSLSFRQVALDNASHFESISDLVFVDDLDEQERLALAQALLQQSGPARLETAPIALAALLEQTGGDPFLIESICRICLDEMKRASKPLITPARVAEAVELFLNRPPDTVVVETFKQIESDPNLLSCALRILEQGEVSKAKLPIATHETPTALDLCGVFVKENSRYRIKCPLWTHLLQQHLAANRVGGLYAMAGYWREAIKYLGEAIGQGQTSVKSELFTTVISAIHASEDAQEAFRYLAQGLQATYPASDVRLYYQSINVLELCYPTGGDEQQYGRISLNNLQRPEVAALHGPDYSIASISQETRLLIPLRFGNLAGRSIGLVSLGGLISPYSPYQQRDEVLQLTGFLRQAAQAIESRSQYAELLNTAEQRANKLTELLKVEETVNDQITKSVKGLLDEIVRSAGRLFGADCAVLYPLRSGLEEGLYLYDLEYIAPWGARQPVAPTDRPRSATGMAARVIREGLVYRSDVKTASMPDGRRFSDTPFIRRERIGAFVGVRLGPREGPVGILYVNWRSSHPLTVEELTIVEVFASFAAVAIPSARRYQQTKATLARRTQELEGLSRVFYASLEFRSEEEVEKAVAQALQTARQHTGVPYLCLIRNEPRGTWRIFQLAPADELTSQSVGSIGTGIARAAFIKRQSQLVVDVGPLQAGAFPDRYHPDSRSGLAVPVKVASHCLAVLLLESPERYGLTLEHQEFLEHLTGGLALTLDQAERTQALRQLLDIFSSLQLMQKAGLQRVLVSVVEQAMDAMRTVDAITLYYVEEETGQLVLGYMAGVEHEADVKRYPPYTRTIIDQVWQLDTPIFAQDTTENGLLSGPFIRREGIKSAAAFPLKADGERVGCIFFNYRFHHVFDKGEKSLLSLFAQLAALAIHQATLYDQVERRKQRLETVARITPIISASLSPDDVLRAVLNEVKQAVPQAHNACMVQQDEAKQELFINPVSLEFYRVDHPPEYGSYRVGTAERQGIAGRVIATGQAANVPDTGEDPNYIASIAATRSELCVPIIIEQKTQAALVLESHNRNAFTADDQRLIEMLADHVAIAIQNARQYAELETAKEELQRTQDRELREHMARVATGLIHDINSAVASIPDLVSEIEEKIKTNVDVSAPLSDLRKGARETGRISQGLRDWVITKEFKPRSFDLEELIQKVLKKAQRRRPAHIRIYYGGEGQAPDIVADALWIESLLQNLIANAYEAILPEQEGLVEIEVVSDPASVRILVKDNGQGIAPENIHRIFEPGYTTKDDDSPLHGFGLSHCLLLVHEHQGDLQVKSTPDAGTVFTVLLPRMLHSLPDSH